MVRDLSLLHKHGSAHALGFLQRTSDVYARLPSGAPRLLSSEPLQRSSHIARLGSDFHNQGIFLPGDRRRSLRIDILDPIARAASLAAASAPPSIQRILPKRRHGGVGRSSYPHAAGCRNAAA